MDFLREQSEPEGQGQEPAAQNRNDMKIEIKKSTLDNLGTDAVVVFASKAKANKEAKGTKKNSAKSAGESKVTALVEGVGKALQAKVQGSVEQGVITGGASETMFFRDAGLAGAQHLVVVGVGNSENFTHEVLRQALASA